MGYLHYPVAQTVAARFIAHFISSTVGNAQKIAPLPPVQLSGHHMEGISVTRTVISGIL
jgi:hypothetical protein